MVTLRFFTWSKELLLWCESVATIYFKAKEKQTVKKGNGEVKLFGPRELHHTGSVPSKQEG